MNDSHVFAPGSKTLATTPGTAVGRLARPGYTRVPSVRRVCGKGERSCRGNHIIMCSVEGERNRNMIPAWGCANCTDFAQYCTGFHGMFRALAPIGRRPERTFGTPCGHDGSYAAPRQTAPPRRVALVCGEYRHAPHTSPLQPDPVLLSPACAGRSPRAPQYRPANLAPKPALHAPRPLG
jgi:hypothetical protein